MITNSRHLIRPRSRFFTLLCLLLGISTLHAFFPNPNPLLLDVGTSGVVEVRGSNGTAKVSLQSISISPSNGGIVGGVTHDLTATRNGEGSVNVNFTGLAPGTYVVTFSGTNNDKPVQGFTTIFVGAPPGTSAQNPNTLDAVDPINTRTGEYFGTEAVDLNLGGPMPLIFSRYMASKLTADGLVQAALGNNRSHNFASRTFADGSDVRRVVLPSGRRLRFDKSGTNWVLKAPLDFPYQLAEDAGVFSLGNPRTNQIWSYNAAGRLAKIEDTHGNVHTLTYDGANRLTSVSDGLGRTLTFAYEGSGRIASVTDHTGRHVDFTYTGANLATAADTLGKITTYAYDGAGLLTSYTRPEGNTPFTQVFTAGKVTSQTERGTDTTTLTYGANSTTITQPNGDTMTHEYAPTGEITSLTDEGGKTLAITKDAARRRTGGTDREGDKTSIVFHAPTGIPAVITNAEGRTTTNTFKERKGGKLSFFDVVKTTFPDGTSESSTYDAKGNQLTRTDRAGKKSSATYNNRGQPLTMTNATGGMMTFTYDAAGNLVSSKDSATGATTYAYDTLNRLTTVTRPGGGGTVTFTYDERDRVLTTTDERGKTTTFTYDDNNRPETITDANTNTATFAYDVLDRVTGITDRLGKTSTRAFDSRRLLASVTDRNGNAMTYGYDARQRPTTATDAGGKTWTREFDDESLLSAAATPLDPPGKIKRNSMGRVIEASDALGNTTAVTRDAMQRVTQSFDPLGRATTFTYDKRGLLIGTTEASGAAAKYTRDALGNVTAIAAPNGAIWKNSYTQEGRLQASTDPLGNSWQNTYDQRGRPATVAFPDATTATLTYDTASNVTRRQFTNSPDINITYDNLNRPATITDTDTAGSGITLTYDAESRITNSAQNGVNFGATYDDGGRLKTVTLDDGAIVVTYAYDTRNRLTGVSDNVSGATVTFTHDDAGRVTAITRANGVNTTHTYDAAGRLTRIQHGTAIDIKYTRNAVGEVTAEDFTAPTLPAAPATSDVFAFGKAGQLTSTGYTYDLRGRLTTAPGHTLAWDDASRLVSNNGVTYDWNGLGEIIARTEGTTTRYFHHHAVGGSPIAAERASGSATTTRHYVHTPGGILLYALENTSGPSPIYYHFDHLGNTLALSNVVGAITDSYARGPYGENEQHTGASTQPFTWLGALGVRKDGPLFHMRARWYDPKTARFLTRDPLPPRLADVKSLNPYAYANQNPLRYVDPAGTDPMSPDWANKSGGVGVGGETTLGGSNGINIRTYVTPQLGLELSCGFHIASVSNVEDDGDTAASATSFNLGMTSHYKLAYWQRGHLSAFLGLDIQTLSCSVGKPPGAAHSTGAELLIGLGIMGEYFPTQYLSLFTQAGLLLDFISEEEAGAISPDFGEDSSGFEISLGSQLEGAAGFTVWFK